MAISTLRLMLDHSIKCGQTLLVVSGILLKRRLIAQGCGNCKSMLIRCCIFYGRLRL